MTRRYYFFNRAGRGKKFPGSPAHHRPPIAGQPSGSMSSFFAPCSLSYLRSIDYVVEYADCKHRFDSDFTSVLHPHFQVSCQLRQRNALHKADQLRSLRRYRHAQPMMVAHSLLQSTYFSTASYPEMQYRRYDCRAKILIALRDLLPENWVVVYYL
nr:hypothetical protein CFP56_74639 [Quercus suber]